MDVELLGSRVLIERDPTEEVSDGGIALILDQIQDQLKGTVRAVGPGRMTSTGIQIPMKIKEGDRVFFETGTRVMIAKKEYVVVFEKDILLIDRTETEQQQTT